MDMSMEVQRLHRKVSAWLKKWAQEKYHADSYEDSFAEVKLYLDGEVDYVSTPDVRTLQFWHQVKYLNSVLNEQRPSLEDLALSVRYAEALVQFEKSFDEAGQGGSLLPDSAAAFFALAALAGWREVAGRIGRLVRKGLDTELLELRHSDEHRAGEHYRHFWFVMHLYEQASGDHFDVANYSYPRDMAPYSDAIEHWRTTDLQKVHELVCKLADVHVAETRNASHDQSDEFSGESEMLFPYEILCWLRLREWAGLPNPDSFDHPLMQQPLAQLPKPVPLPVPEVPLLDEVIAKFKQDYPGSFA